MRYKYKRAKFVISFLYIRNSHKCISFTPKTFICDVFHYFKDTHFEMWIRLVTCPSIKAPKLSLFVVPEHLSNFSYSSPTLKDIDNRQLPEWQHEALLRTSLH